MSRRARHRRAVALDPSLIVSVGVGMVISLFLATVTMTWWLRSALLFVLIAIVTGLALYSSWTLALKRVYRILIPLLLAFILVAMNWNSIRTEYKQEHNPSFVYIVPGFWSPPTTWYMMVRHYGPSPIYNIEVMFTDLDRANEFRRLPSITPQQIEQESLTLHISEIDPTETIQAKLFPWTPANLDHSQFDIAIASSTGRFRENLQIARTQGRWAYQMKIVSVESGRVFINCRDRDFPVDNSQNPRAPRCFPRYTAQHMGD